MSSARLRWVVLILMGLGLTPVISMGLVCAVVLGIGAPDANGTPTRRPLVGQLAVPPRWAQVEVAAAGLCPDLPWSILGSLGWLASRSGRAVRGQPPPWWGWDGGVFGVVAGDVQHHLDPLAAATRAASVICAAEATGGTLTAGLIALTGRSSWALEVEVLAVSLRDSPSLLDQDAAAIDFAVHALGTPYEWGGNGPDSYDCSGLIVAAEHAAGRTVPRTAQAQHDASRREPPPGKPGDLAFFGSGQSDIGHVGLIVGDGLMIDAPHTGAVVRIESYGWTELVDEGAPSD